jgi:hypothetical protein
MLEHLKATNGHATRNVLKKHQSLINGPSIPIPKTSSFSRSKPIIPTSYTSPSLDFTPSGNDGEKSMTNQRCYKASLGTWQQWHFASQRLPRFKKPS